MTRNNLRKLHSQQSRMEEARKEYEEAPKIDRKLAQKNPESYLPHLATRRKNLRKLDSHQKCAYRESTRPEDMASGLPHEVCRTETTNQTDPDGAPRNWTRRQRQN